MLTVSLDVPSTRSCHSGMDRLAFCCCLSCLDAANSASDSERWTQLQGRARDRRERIYRKITGVIDIGSRRTVFLRMFIHVAIGRKVHNRCFMKFMSVYEYVNLISVASKHVVSHDHDL